MKKPIITKCPHCGQDFTKPDSIDVVYQSWGKAHITPLGEFKPPSSTEILFTSVEDIMIFCSQCDTEIDV